MTDEKADEGLYIQLFSLHGLIRGRELELGRDADTGGQTKYTVEFARALGEHPEVGQVDLFTRRIQDGRVSEDYAEPLEPLSEHARIVRLACGGKKYLRKELLWPHLDEFVDRALHFTRAEGRFPDVVHGHYADAGYVAMELAGLLGVPLIFTGHSLGRNKVEVLTNAGLEPEAIEAQYHIKGRIEVEEEVLQRADLVIASTQHEVGRGYELYEAHKSAHYKVIPPGIEVDTFYPYYYDEEENFDISEEQRQAKATMREEIQRFLNAPEKPLVLAISRPDRRKNIDGLVTAFGADKELRVMANLAIFAGVRKDISAMDDNERDVLTQMLLLMDKYDLYGKLALPKKHDPETDIPVLYRLAAASGGVFVNPALVENFGITLIEASSSGLPVVSTDHGGPQDIIKNCHSGILVDASEPEEISEAIKKILIDKELWREFSHDGVIGVREHYSWEAHCRSYMEAVDEMLAGQGKDDSRIGRRLDGLESFFISDIDNTLLGDEQALADFSRAVQERQLGFGLASGRSLERVHEVLEEYDLPAPDIIISSVGTEIYYGPDGPYDRGYQRHISYQWKPEKVHAALAELACLKPQEEENQRRFKISYYVEDAECLDKTHAALEASKLRCNVIYSQGNIDILPQRASKGKAVRYLSYKWSLPAKKIVVAGDSGNDEDMLRGNRSIVVGNHAPELDALRGKKRVYFATGRYARGVLEGLQHYGLL
jgi:sucrose-phosphate synthase